MKKSDSFSRIEHRLNRICAILYVFVFPATLIYLIDKLFLRQFDWFIRYPLLLVCLGVVFSICFIIGVALGLALEESVGGEGAVSGINAEGEIGAAFMTDAQLKFAGRLSITNAILAILIIIILLFLEAKVSYAILTLLSLFLFVYIFSSFRKLVRYQFDFSLVNVLISVMIWLYTALSLIDVLDTAGMGGPFLFSVMGEDISIGDILSVATFILFGLVSCVFAVLLLDLSDNLFGLLKPFSYATITGGVCIATVFLLPVGLVALIVRDVILGIIFFKAVGLSTRQPI